MVHRLELFLELIWPLPSMDGDTILHKYSTSGPTCINTFKAVQISGVITLFLIMCRLNSHTSCGMVVVTRWKAHKGSLVIRIVIA